MSLPTGELTSIPPESRPSSPPSSRRWWALAVIGLAQLMIMLDATIVNIALPSAQADLGFSDNDRQWIVTAYALTFGSLLLIGGRIADLFGRKQTFLAGVIGFAAASVLGGAAGNFELLVLARALQGVSGALLAPAALSLLTTLFTDVKERGRAFSIFGAIAGAGGALGNLLGGVLTEYLNWRWTLYINLAFAAAAFLGGLLLIERQPRATQRAKLDIPGAVLVTLGLFGLVYGFSNAESRGWGSPASWGLLVGGLVLLVLFAYWQSTTARPLLPLRILLDRDRGASQIAILVATGGMYAVALFLAYYMQQTLKYTPVEAGLAFLPIPVALVVASGLAVGVLMPRVGPKIVIPLGMALLGVGMIWFTRLELDSTYASGILPPLIVLGLGLGMVYAPAIDLATYRVHEDDSGVASAAVNTTQQIGGSLGIAVLNTLAASAASSYLSSRQATPEVFAEAALHSYSTAYWWAAGLAAVGLVVTFLLYRPGVREKSPDAVKTVAM
ncbi:MULTISPECIES: MFS transporter [unclassified Streptomyces]|uniref:MFS transporter n=1 Tax=unclassified Streptomyces TaxID=2593676 RepID=UPI0036567B2E